MPKADISNYKGREQAYVKHYLLERYLFDWAYKVSTTWDTLVYVDGFAGPWETTDPEYKDSSFAIGIDTLRKCQIGLQSKDQSLSMAAVLVESDKDAFAKLNSFAEANTSTDLPITAIPGKFSETIPQINQCVRKAGRRPFKFVLLDPKGWADIPMRNLRLFLNARSCEVLITLMTKHITRFLNEEDRAVSYNNLFGRAGVLESLQQVVGEDRVELAVREYGRSLQQLCDFRFVSSAVILEPDEARTRYFLVFATNHPRGIEVFKAAETKASDIQEKLRKQKATQKTSQIGFDFPDERPLSSYTFRLYKRYQDLARAKVIECLKSASRANVPYWKIFCEAMAFPLVTPDDLLNWLDDLDPYIELHPMPGHKKLSPARDDYITVIDRHSLL